MPLGWTGFAFGAIVLACVLADGVGTLTSLGAERLLFPMDRKEETIAIMRPAA